MWQRGDAGADVPAILDHPAAWAGDDRAADSLWESVTVDTEEMHVSGLWVQAHAAAPLRGFVPVGTRDDGLTECAVGSGDSPIQVGIGAEFFDDVDLHFDTAAADLEVFGPNTDDDLRCGSSDLAR